jgi:hypothetical protein
MRRITGILLLVLLMASPSWAAITFDTASSSGGTTSTSHSHTVAVDANIAIVCIGQREIGAAVQAPSNVTIGGEAASSLTSATASTNALRVDLYYKLSPLTGTQTVAATGGAGTDRMVTGVMTFKGVAQTSTFNTAASLGSSAAGTNADLTGIASAVGELVVLCGQSRIDTVTPSPDPTVPSSTERYEQAFSSGGTSTLGFGYTEDGANSTIDMRIDLATSDTWALAAASMRPAAETRRNRGVIFTP